MSSTSVTDFIQDSPLGQALRFLTKGKLFAFPEDDPNFKIPWEEASVSEKEQEIEAAETALASSRVASHQTSTSVSRHASNVDKKENDDDIEARVPGLTTIPTSHSSAARSAIGPVTTRTLTRERTIPYSRERFEVEEQEAIERRQSSIIVPQRTSDGVILVDWYTTDDPAVSLMSPCCRIAFIYSYIVVLVEPTKLEQLEKGMGRFDHFHVHF